MHDFFSQIMQLPLGHSHPVAVIASNFLGKVAAATKEANLASLTLPAI